MSENAFLWSVTAADNDDADPAVSWPENMLPGAVNNSARSTMAAVARLLKDMNGTITSGGSANAYTVTSSSGHSTYTNGALITIKASFTNTAAATLNMNTYGAKKIRVFIGGAEADAAAGQIVSGGTYQFRYDSGLDSSSGAFLLLNPTPDPTTILSVGTVKVWSTDTLETGWLWANGEAVSRTTYAALFAKISTTYGVGDNSTTFNLPDLCGRALFGSDDMGGISAKGRVTNAGSSIVGTTLGATGGAQNVQLTTAQMPSHGHTNSTSGVTASGTTGTESAFHTHGVSGDTGDESAFHTHSGTSSSDGAHVHAVSGGTVGGTSFNASGLGTQATSVPTSVSNIVVDSNGTHTHTTTTGNQSAAHHHAVSITAGVQSALHSHDVSVTGTAAAQTISSSGSDGAHTNMPPAIIMNFVIKY